MSASDYLAEIVQYLKNDSGFERLMNGMFDLYNRYGRCFSAREFRSNNKTSNTRNPQSHKPERLIFFGK
jgi:hypothetical protein